MLGLTFFYTMYIKIGGVVKKVRVTWRGDCGETYIDECLLIEEDDAIYAVGPGGIDIPTFNLFDKLAKEGRVVFEDEEGIFCLKTEDVISVEVLR